MHTGDDIYEQQIAQSSKHSIHKHYHYHYHYDMVNLSHSPTASYNPQKYFKTQRTHTQNSTNTPKSSFVKYNQTSKDFFNSFGKTNQTRKYSEEDDPLSVNIQKDLYTKKQHGKINKVRQSSISAFYGLQNEIKETTSQAQINQVINQNHMESQFSKISLKKSSIDQAQKKEKIILRRKKQDNIELHESEVDKNVNQQNICGSKIIIEKEEFYSVLERYKRIEEECDYLRSKFIQHVEKKHFKRKKAQKLEQTKL